MLEMISIRIIPKEPSLCLSQKCYYMLVYKWIDLVIVLIPDREQTVIKPVPRTDKFCFSH